jgi:hypothetical protein
MQPPRPAIWIRPADAPNQLPEPTAAPLLSGAAEVVARVMHKLAQVLDPATGLDIVTGGRVIALQIGSDEATLTLSLGIGHCDSAHHVAEEAFAALRGELPDTDLYLLHHQTTPCAEPSAG